MEKLLEGKVALITGASRGIGKAIALRFAAEGASIAFTHVTPSITAEQTEQEISALGVHVKRYVADAANHTVTEALVADVTKEFGRIDILVNNAGITQDTLLMRMNEQQWDEVISSNLKSAFNFCRFCTPVMMRQRSGSIINISSVVGLHGNAGQCNYAASKAGIIGLTKSIAAEMGSRGVRANVIAPGFINTDMTGKLSEELRTEWAKQIPLRRAGESEDIAGAALFLASDLAAYITGQVLQVDGGMAM
jgi:3-oxoacyl-[acyl-carrier protein] reductase